MIGRREEIQPKILGRKSHAEVQRGGERRESPKNLGRMKVMKRRNQRICFTQLVKRGKD